MWLLRSAFWLAIAFVLVHPAHTELAGDGQALARTALGAARSVAQTGISGVACTTLQCSGAKVLVTAAIGEQGPRPVSDQTMPAGRAPGRPPIPQPRLQRKG